MSRSLPTTPWDRCSIVRVLLLVGALLEGRKTGATGHCGRRNGITNWRSASDSVVCGRGSGVKDWVQLQASAVRLALNPGQGWPGVDQHEVRPGWCSEPDSCHVAEGVPWNGVREDWTGDVGFGRWTAGEAAGEAADTGVVSRQRRRGGTVRLARWGRRARMLAMEKRQADCFTRLVHFIQVIWTRDGTTPRCGYQHDILVSNKLKLLKLRMRFFYAFGHLWSYVYIFFIREHCLYYIFRTFKSNSWRSIHHSNKILDFLSKFRCSLMRYIYDSTLHNGKITISEGSQEICQQKEEEDITLLLFKWHVCPKYIS